MCMRSDAQGIAHHPPTEQAPQGAEESKMTFHTLQKSFHMVSYGMEYSFGQFKSVVLILSQP